MKKIFLLFFLLFGIIFGEMYTPQNISEEKILEKYRKEKIKLSAEKSPMYISKIIDRKSLDDIILDLFNNYLGIETVLEEKNFTQAYEEVKNNRVDGVALLSKNEERGRFLVYSDTIFNESVYVASFDKNITNLNELKGKEVYGIKDSIHNDYFKNIVDNNDLDIKIKEIDSYDDLNKGEVITSAPLLLNVKSYFKVSYSSGVAIALNRKYEDLIPIINRALDLKYRAIIQKRLKDLNKEYAIINFQSNLTEREQRYLTDKDHLTVLIEKNENISYEDEKTGAIKGNIPKILEELGEQLGISIEMVRTPAITENILKSLRNRKYDFLVLSKTSERTKDFIFSDRLFDINTYVIFKNNGKKNNKIGVLKGGIESHLLLRYEIKENIKEYTNNKALLEALKRDKVEFVLTNDIEDFSPNEYNIYPFETIPINFAFRKEDEELRSIINKGLKYAIELSEVLKESYIEKKQNDKNILDSGKKIKNILISIILLSIVLIIYLTMKYILKARTNKKLLRDPLTDLNNRTVFNRFCKNEGNELEGSVFVIDFNNFKMVNDKYGHEFGDLVLAEFGRYIKKIFDDRYIFRISGDEFYGFFEENVEEEIEKLRDYKRFCPNLDKHDITFNIGIYKKKAYENIETAFKYADLAMLENKKNKKSFFKIADEIFIKRKYKEQEILKILDGELDEFYGVFQPKMSLKTEKIIGAEALARCKSRELGAIFPNEFIPIAEDHNKIHKIDFKIFDETCKNMKNWLENGIVEESFRVSFNLSVKTFAQPDLIEKIGNIMQKYGVSGKNLEVEITESIFMSNIKEIVEKLNAIIKMGIEISLDDFTAGHATAGILPILPIKIVKFDKSLLDSINENEEKGKIVYLKLVSLIKELKLKIVAEGVETLSDFNYLKEIGVDCIQGYLIGKPDIYENFDIKINKE